MWKCAPPSSPLRGRPSTVADRGKPPPPWARHSAANGIRARLEYSLGFRLPSRTFHEPYRPTNPFTHARSRWRSAHARSEPRPPSIEALVSLKLRKPLLSLTCLPMDASLTRCCEHTLGVEGHRRQAPRSPITVEHRHHVSAPLFRHIREGRKEPQ